MSGADVAAIKLPEGLLGRAGILGADDRMYAVVDCPELGGAVRVASMTGEARAKIEAISRRARDGEFVAGSEMEAWIVVQCAVDDAGARVFSDSDVPEVMRKNGAVISRLAAAAADLSGVPLGGDAPDPVEDTAGN